MYTIHKLNTNGQPKFVRRIAVYEDLQVYIYLLLSFIACVVVFVFLEGLYPPPIMDLLEKVGVVEYTESTDVRISSGDFRYRGSSLPYDYLDIKYKDKSGKIQKDRISLTFVDWEYLDDDFLEETGHKCPIAYYSFLPSYSILRFPSVTSLSILYILLVKLFWILFGWILDIRKTKSLLSNFTVGTLVRPLYYTIDYEHKQCTHYAIWETPVGERWALLPIKANRFELKSISFENEYCGIYICNDKGKALIIQPDELPYIKKEYGYEINGLEVTISKDFQKKSEVTKSVSKNGTKSESLDGTNQKNKRSRNKSNRPRYTSDGKNHRNNSSKHLATKKK